MNVEVAGDKFARFAEVRNRCRFAAGDAEGTQRAAAQGGTERLDLEQSHFGAGRVEKIAPDLAPLATRVAMIGDIQANRQSVHDCRFYLNTSICR